MVLTALATSCKKEKSTEPNLPGSGADGGGNFQPKSKNSYWKYKTTGSLNYEATNTSTGQARTVNGITGIVYTEYQYCSGWNNRRGVRYQRPQLLHDPKGDLPNSGATFDLSFLYLNDTASIGYAWRHDAGQANGIQAIFEGRIVEKEYYRHRGGENL